VGQPPLPAEEAVRVAGLRRPGQKRQEEVARRDPICDLVVPASGELELVVHPGLDPRSAEIRREPPHALGVLTGVAQEQAQQRARAIAGTAAIWRDMAP
jgi:hypothetical protein